MLKLKNTFLRQNQLIMSFETTVQANVCILIQEGHFKSSNNGCWLFIINKLSANDYLSPSRFSPKPLHIFKAFKNKLPFCIALWIALVHWYKAHPTPVRVSDRRPLSQFFNMGIQQKITWIQIRALGRVWQSLKSNGYFETTTDFRAGALSCKGFRPRTPVGGRTSV